jgi:perosamine synthetase
MEHKESTRNRDAVSRRRFISASSVAAGATAQLAVNASRAGTPPTGKPALLGGAPVKPDAFPSWPVAGATDENAVTEVLRSGKWGRGSGTKVLKFEQLFSEMMAAKACLATSSGTSALLVSLNALGIGPGDEVIVPPYTFVATINVVLMCHALPVFVDTHPDTFQIDASKIEAAITERTKAIIPVHLGGSTFDVDAVQAVARKHNLPIVEDSCQSHLAEWRGNRTGSFGALGCFSFQASKNLNSGEGGAILSASDELIDRCYTFHNNSRSRKQAGSDFSYVTRGLNLRMTEFQAGLLATQMTRLESQSQRRGQNAQYLTSLLREIPGLTPARMHDGCTRNAYHLYMMRYDARQFGGLPRATFLKALEAEGIPASGGYVPLNKQPFLKNSFASRGFQAIYSPQQFAQWNDGNHTPANDKLCSEAVWFTQNMLLGPRRDMDQIADAVRKIQAHAGDLLKV